MFSFGKSNATKILLGYGGRKCKFTRKKMFFKKNLIFQKKSKQVMSFCKMKSGELAIQKEKIVLTMRTTCTNVDFG